MKNKRFIFKLLNLFSKQKHLKKWKFNKYFNFNKIKRNKFSNFILLANYKPKFLLKKKKIKKRIIFYNLTKLQNKKWNFSRGYFELLNWSFLNNFFNNKLTFLKTNKELIEFNKAFSIYYNKYHLFKSNNYLNQDLSFINLFKNHTWLKSKKKKDLIYKKIAKNLFNKIWLNKNKKTNFKKFYSGNYQFVSLYNKLFINKVLVSYKNLFIKFFLESNSLNKKFYKNLNVYDKNNKNTLILLNYFKINRLIDFNYGYKKKIEKILLKKKNFFKFNTNRRNFFFLYKDFSDFKFLYKKNNDKELKFKKKKILLKNFNIFLKFLIDKKKHNNMFDNFLYFLKNYTYNFNKSIFLNHKSLLKKKKKSKFVKIKKEFNKLFF